MKKVSKNLLQVLLGTSLVSSLFGPIADRVQGMVGSTLFQVKEASTGLLKTLLEMIVVACLGFVGVVFILMGLAIFLESQVEVPGSGLAYVGVGILLFALLTLLVMKYHKNN